MLLDEEIAEKEAIVHGKHKQQVAKQEKSVAATEEQMRTEDVEVGEIEHQWTAE